MITQEEKKVYGVLAELNIPYTRYEHPPVYTIEEMKRLNLPDSMCKNLFVRNQKGDKHYLVILEHTKKADLQKLAEQIGSGKLSFASEKRLQKYLGLKPGSVSPFGLINDSEKEVEVVIDKDLADSGEVSFHPNVNTATVTISYGDFEKYLKWCKNSITYVRI
jgi:Ala-tRNA(Pro) deacylase